MLAIAQPLAAAPSPAARRHNSLPPGLTTWALALALALCELAWGAWPAYPSAPAAPRTHAPHTAPPAVAQTQPTQAPMAADMLAALRQAAALGNVQASVTLVGALLDRYDDGAGAGALAEAVQWMERDLDTVPMLASPQVQRMVLGPCARDPLLQWHWLCNQGE